MAGPGRKSKNRGRKSGSASCHCKLRTANCELRTANCPCLPLWKIDSADAWLAVSLEGFVDEDEAETGVFVEACQPLPQAASICLLTPALRGGPELRRHRGGGVPDSDLLAVAERQHRYRHGARGHGRGDAGPRSPRPPRPRPPRRTVARTVC